MNEKTEILKDVTSLRAEIRRLWGEIDAERLSSEEALTHLDTLADFEIGGECRSEIMDILDKASLRVGGRAPSVIETAEKDRVLPEELVKAYSKPPKEREKTREATSGKIIQLPRRRA